MTPFIGHNMALSMFWLHLHCIFVGTSLLGAILITVWILKNLSGEKLKNITLWILVIGIMGMLLTAPLAFGGFNWMAKTMHGNQRTSCPFLQEGGDYYKKSGMYKSMMQHEIMNEEMEEMMDNGMMHKEDGSEIMLPEE